MQPDSASCSIALGAPVLSVLVPVYNEIEVLPEFHRRMTAVLRTCVDTYEVVYVNDGSSDGSLQWLQQLCADDPDVALVDLSRNFGKEIAMAAGLDHVRGEAVVVIDADLQDPPELIPRLLEQWRAGFDNVYARRRQRDGETWLKKASASWFYRLIGKLSRVAIPQDTGDFRLLSRRAVEALRALREQHRFMKGLFAWIGYPSIAVEYDRDPRLAGQTKFNYWKLWNFAIEGITSFTIAPLKLATYLGLLVAMLAFVAMAVLIAKTLLYGDPVKGYPSLMCVILFLGGIQLAALGMLGEYIGRMFNEVKGRPLYFTKQYVPSRHARR
ncbi:MULTISPECIES: glycosyltransferase family 2 protein [Thermomonas]|uniref:Glycosyltransferase family 2 protein n=1 Tax=Thermomonas beijingensis TaxID=2872701 RepID=A0ABS7TEZ5_9GAMM|nr:glycosyltransferase family 2 protein [Thermomonas beijingensis]MBS0460086.1 glycosyltransferase family 2 protein [Pseudomonadota bacterium]MBZ4186416.1 glycosyltransferase family 2 protein [Thermomonas beijingensis]MDE2381918.1 glycosyltransferase family 2 protein [Xanthomonadaceae bacterium]HQQ58469.1 glycosyltransferase family 2 protein [Thermomonas sp.]